MITQLNHYFANLAFSRQVLWCYLIWYLAMAGFHFDPTPSLWLNAAGISLLVGLALCISTGPFTLSRIRERFWETLRLFACPFLVSSFSAMVKGKGFVLLFSSDSGENALAAAACGLFLLLTALLRRMARDGQSGALLTTSDTPFKSK